jgi:hypothetical protein
MFMNLCFLKYSCKEIANIYKTLKIRYIYGGMIVGVGDQLSELNSHLRPFSEFLQ